MSGKGLPFTPPRCDKYLVQTLLMCRRVGGWVGVASRRCGFWILKDMVHYWYIG